MNYYDWMHAVDEDLLEEAAAPRRRKHYGAIAAAACAALVLLAGVLIWAPWQAGDSAVLQAEQPTPQSQTAPHGGESGNAAEEPLPHESAAPADTADAADAAGSSDAAGAETGVTAQTLAELGYTLSLPDGATNCTYQVMDSTDTPMVQVDFVLEGADYTLRALQAPEPVELVTEPAAHTLTWRSGGADWQLQESGSDSWFGWYDDGIQYCLLTAAANDSLLTTARQIMVQYGLDVAVAPADATDITCQVFSLDAGTETLTVAQTEFVLDGVRYRYRTAATGQIAEDFFDLTCTENYAVNTVGEVGWCSARLSYNDNGAGKIVWFDIAPGLLYSLEMDTAASADALCDAALCLYTPAQGEVG